mgnify:CR=1 FL=1
MMQIRYVAKRSLNATDNSVVAYDFSDVKGEFKTGSNIGNANTPFTISAKFNITFTTRTNYPAQIVAANAVSSIFVDHQGIIEVNNGREVGDVFTPHPTLVAIEGEENEVSLDWDAAGNYTVTLNGVSSTGTYLVFTNYTFRFKISSGINPIRTNGYIYDCTYKENGVLEGSWGCHDGTGTVCAASVGSIDMTLQGSGSTTPAGWGTYTTAHSAGNTYTKQVTLKSMDRSRKAVRQDAFALDGYRQSTYMRGTTTTSCKTSPITGSDVRDMIEFLDSVEGGRFFYFDSGDGRGEVRVQLTSKGYNISRAARLGSGGNGDYFTLGWSYNEE